MHFLEVYCHVRKTNIFLDVRNIVVIEEAALIPGNKKACWIYLDKDYDEQGAYQVHEFPKVIIKKVVELRISK